MSATVPKVFSESADLPNAAAATPGLYVCPTNLTGSLVKKMTVCNHDTSPHTVTVRLVPSGGSEAAAANDIWAAKSIYPGQSSDVFEIENHVMAPGDFITAFADTAAKVACRISGVEFSI